MSPDLWLANTECWHPEVLDLEKSLTLNSQEPFPAELFAEGILLHRTYVTGQGILWNPDLFFVYIFWVKFCAKCCKCHLCFKWVAVCLEVGAALVSRLLWWNPIGTSSWPWLVLESWSQSQCHYTVYPDEWLRLKVLKSSKITIQLHLNFVACWIFVHFQKGWYSESLKALHRSFPKLISVQQLRSVAKCAQDWLISFHETSRLKLSTKIYNNHIIYITFMYTCTCLYNDNMICIQNDIVMISLFNMLCICYI